jgi:3-hydroxyacyl-[acyl-carrier-protein] dehydratase
MLRKLFFHDLTVQRFNNLTLYEHMDILQLAMKSLPHGPEFRFVDRMISLTPGKIGVGEYRVRGDEYFLRGHLPGEPILPGVLLVESAAQVAGMVAQEDPANPRWPRLKLTALRAVKIFDAVRPGETLRIQATITGVLNSLIQAEVSAFVGSNKILSAELTLSGNDSEKKQ